MRIIAPLICLIFLFNACKLAGVEKRRYRSGFFVSTKGKLKHSDIAATSKQERSAIRNKETVKPSQDEAEPVVNTITEVIEKDNARQKNVIKKNTVAHKLHRVSSKQQNKAVSSLTNTQQGIKPLSDELVANLFLLALILIWAGIAIGLFILIPSLTLGICYIISGGLVLLTLFFMVVGTKRSSRING